MIVKLVKSLHQTSANKLILTAIKLVVLCGLTWVVFDKIIHHELTFEIGGLFFQQISTTQILGFAICFIFMFINWVLEANKWRVLLKSGHAYTLIEALKHISCGIAAGIFTPSRIGEYGGRLLLLRKDDRLNGIKAHFVSSLSQNIVNLSIGFIATAFYLNNVLHMNRSISLAIFMLGTCLSIGLYLLYWNHEAVLVKMYKKLPQFITKYLPSNSLTSIMDQPILQKALVISALRYFIFTTQYVLLLYFYGIDIPLIVAYSGVGLIYIIQSGLPLPPVVSMLARGEIALIIWGAFTGDVLPILAATFTLWLLNLLVPAIVGTIVLLRRT